MLKILKCTLCMLLLLGPKVHAEDKRLALIRQPQGVEGLPASIARQLQTLALKVVAKQPGYELLLSGTDAPSASAVDLVAVESELGRQGNFYHFEVRLLDLRKKKLITKASQQNVREEDLVRLFQGALESLFLPDPTAEPAPPEPKTIKKKQQPPSTTQVNSPDEKTIDFKKRIRDLKLSADDAIVKTVEDKREEKEKLEVKKPQDPPNVAPQINLSEAPLPERKDPPKKIYPNTHVLSAGYDSREVQSEYYINTTSRAQLLTLRAQGHLPFSLKNGKIAGSYFAAYSRAVSAPAELPQLYQVGLYGTWLEPRWSASLGLHHDSTFFITTPTPGGGLIPQGLASTWIRAKGEYTLDYRGAWRLEGSLGTPLMAQTDYRPMEEAKSWSGMSMQVAVTPPYSYRGWESTVTIDRMNLSSQGARPFTLNESRLALFVRRLL